MERKKCLECGRELYGRPDKKFCSEECKNRYHNRRRTSELRMQNRVITDLVRNRRILAGLLDAGRDSAELSELELLGFKPSRISGYHKSRQGHEVCDCLDLRYCRSETRIFRLRRVLP